MKWLPGYNYILASKSPRRQDLLRSLGIKFQIKTKDVDEKYPDTLNPDEIPEYLAGIKAKAMLDDGQGDDDLLITADTIVCLDGKVLEKPRNYDDAFNMLQSMSNRKHRVITGVCLTSKNKTVKFSAVTYVWFKQLTSDEIEYYLKKYQPYDKAGAYGIQEWIGYVGICRIDGSFYNVMGLPVQKLYEEIQHF